MKLRSFSPFRTRAFTHDARGNLTGETRPSGSPVTVAYDGRARLTSYSVGTATQTMLYNGADERIRVITTPASGPADTRQFIYDLDHRIVGEYGAGGAADLKAEYIWTLSGVGSAGPTGALRQAQGGRDGTGGYTPLAVAVGVAGQSGITSEVQWVHSGHLGTPILTTNASGTAVTPYGYAAIGFPGQFASALLLPGAEHYYNRYRDYDPTTGRYIQADPIGLAGGSNPWGYAYGNPLKYSDPTGLNPGLAACALAGPGAPACVGVGLLGSGLVLAVGAIGVWLENDDCDYCYERWNREYSKCGQWSYLGARAVAACRERAANRRNLCVRNKGRPVPWEPAEWDPWKDWYGEQDDIDP